jgi:hypothetical protein
VPGEQVVVLLLEIEQVFESADKMLRPGAVRRPRASGVALDPEAADALPNSLCQIQLTLEQGHTFVGRRFLPEVISQILRDPEGRLARIVEVVP